VTHVLNKFILALLYCVLVRAEHQCVAQVQPLSKIAVKVDELGHKCSFTEMQQPTLSWKPHSFLKLT